ncbi:uncharacterized protein BDZ99DRAFT_374740, partial [Mytilinidion resinicola]
RLSVALDQLRSRSPLPPVSFTLKIFPYQLYPEASKEGEDKYEWYKKSRYGDSEEKMKMYTSVMSAYGKSCGIDFKFGGTVANTIDAHRVLQWVQETKGEEGVRKAVELSSTALYSQYFEHEQHPSSKETLFAATAAAGVPEAEAKAFIEDEYEGLQDVKMLIREQAGNAVDAVPYVVFEGKRRDFTLQGAKEVEEYVKAMEQVIKESS